MENSFEHPTSIQRASYPTYLMELNRMFVQLYAYRLQEILLQQQHQQQQGWNQQQETWAAAVETPAPSPTNFCEDQSSIYSTAEQSPLAESRTENQKRNLRTKVRFNPYQLQRRPKHLSAVLAKDPIEVEIQLNENMVRRYNQASNDRTPQEREQLERNAYMVRVSRAKSRALEALLEKEHDEAAKWNRTQKLSVSRKRVYVNELYHLLGQPRRDLTAEWEQFRMG